MLSRGIPWREYATRHLYFPYTHELLGVECVYEENTSDKWHTSSTVSHEKALHNYCIPCLNLRKIYGNFRKLRKRSKPVIEELL